MSEHDKINHPRAPANPPQHPVPDEGAPVRVSDRVRQTGVGTAGALTDVTDPHPSDEGDPYDARRPGGAKPPKRDIGPNSATHEGIPRRRPDNASTRAEE
jgi:hypothetical protein